MMNQTEYEEFIRKSIKGMGKKESLEWVESKIFLIDMIDTWQEEDKMMWETLSKIKQELWKQS